MLTLVAVQGSGQLNNVALADWTAPTIDSWRHSVWVGVWDPWIVVFKVCFGHVDGAVAERCTVVCHVCALDSRRHGRRARVQLLHCSLVSVLPTITSCWLLADSQGPRIWYKTLREIVTLERMHRAFDDGLMEVRRLLCGCEARGVVPVCICLQRHVRMSAHVHGNLFWMPVSLFSDDSWRFLLLCAVRHDEGHKENGMNGLAFSAAGVAYACRLECTNEWHPG